MGQSSLIVITVANSSEDSVSNWYLNIFYTNKYKFDDTMIQRNCHSKFFPIKFVLEIAFHKFSIIWEQLSLSKMVRCATLIKASFYG